MFEFPNAFYKYCNEEGTVRIKASNLESKFLQMCDDGNRHV